MQSLAVRHPAYAWSHNMGYATAEHLAGLDRQGASPHHRRSFSSVAQTRLVFGVSETVVWSGPANDD